jgi:GT2 family glycosyltransferase
MDVSVTIVNWNQASLLEKCLRSIFATSRTVQYEVIVVDNASDDDSIAMVRACYPQAKLICNARNVGFGRAQNQALAVARGRYVLLLNNDATVRPDTIPTLVQFMDRHPRVGSCSCPDYRQAALGTAYSGAFRRFPSLARTLAENLWAVFHPPRSWDLRWFTLPVHRWLGETLTEVETLEVAWVVGALMLVRKETLDQVGGFDERFFLFDEDIDLCRRIWAAGWTVAFTTATSFTHQGGASSALREDIERIRGESRAWYFRKYSGRLTTLLFHVQHYVLRTCLLSWRRRFESTLRIHSRGTETSSLLDHHSLSHPGEIEQKRKP